METPAAKNYADLYLRWLCAKRDYHHDVGPAPEPPGELFVCVAAIIRDRLTREVFRKN